MAGAARITVEEVVRKVLVDEHAEVLREAVKGRLRAIPAPNMWAPARGS